MTHTATANPDAAILLLTAGILLLIVEFNRPGFILPGACGLALSLIAVAWLIRLPIARSSAQACALAALVLFASYRLPARWTTRRWVRLAVTGAAFLLLFYGFGNVTVSAPSSQFHLATVIACALILSVGTSLLTTIAARARQNKGLDLQ